MTFPAGILASSRVAPSGPLVSDSFNRADTTTSLGTADTGQAWTNLGNGMGITGNKAYAPSANNLAYHGALIVAQANVAVSFVHSPALSFSGVLGRWSDENNHWRLDMNDDNNWRLLRRNAGTFTVPASGTTAVRGRLKLTMSGSSITVHIESTLLASITDSFNSTATTHGICSESPLERYEDFLIQSA